MLINGEKAFTVPENNFAISASESGYTLAYSTDGVTFAEKDEVPADEPCFVLNVPKRCVFKLVGNTGDVKIQY